ncbi:hypothetical protein Fcan01_10595, partial [Folsomia candida]
MEIKYPAKSIPVKISPGLMPPPPPGLTQQVNSFLKFTRCIARCPMTFENIANKKQVKFQLKICSSSFLSSLNLALVLNTVLVVGFLKYGDILYSVYDVFPRSGMSMSALYVAFALIGYLITFLKAPKLAKWLNHLNEIEDEMQKIDSKQSKRDKIKINNFLRYFIPLFEFFPILVFGVFETVLRFDADYPIHCVLATIYAYLPGICYAIIIFYDQQEAKIASLLKKEELKVKFGTWGSDYYSSELHLSISHSSTNMELKYSAKSIPSKIAPGIISPPSPGLTQQVNSFFKFARYIARCPITFENIPNKKQVKFRFKMCSSSFLLSMNFALVLNTVIAVGFLNYSDILYSVYDVFPRSGIWPPSNPNAESVESSVSAFSFGLIKSMNALYIAYASIGYLIAFLKTPKLEKWLNHWNEIEDEMQKIGSNRDKINIDKFLRYFITLFEFFPILIFGVFETMLRFDADYPIHCVLATIYAFLPGICYAVDDSQALIMLKCLQETKIVSLLRNEELKVKFGTFGTDYYSSERFWGCLHWPPPKQFGENIKNRVGEFVYCLIWSFAPISILMVSIDHVLAFLKAPELAEWLNNWNAIEDEMLQLGFNRDKIKITTFSRYFIPLFEFVPSLIFGSLNMIWLVDIRYPLHCLISFIYSYLPHICYAVEDSKALLMLKCLQVGFLQ